MRTALLLLLLAPGCDPWPWLVDDDLDRSPLPEDCNDKDPAVHPGADETCNGQDDDCDGTVDDQPVDAPTWYADADQDGYGDPEAALDACSSPSGFVMNANDCDDTRADALPGGTEVCDGADNDCDGAVDEDATDPLTWYRDEDGDGWGLSSLTTQACDAPSGYCDQDGDCDDDDDTVHPGAEETCDGVDQDCDSDVDEDATDASTWYQDNDDDGYGVPSSETQACERPSGFAATADDCDDTNANVAPGLDEACDDKDNDCDGSVDEDATTGLARWYKDTDGDGYGNGTSTWTDACDAPSGHVADATDCDDGDASVHPGAAETCDAVDSDCDGSTNDPDSAGATPWYKDSDGDGYGDPDSATWMCTAASPWGTDATDCDDGDPEVHPGAVDVHDDLDGDCDGVADSTAVGTGPRVWGPLASTRTGEAVTTGDVNGDGEPDILVGAPDYAGMGALYVGLGPISADTTLSTTSRWSEAGTPGAGASLAWLGDPLGEGVSTALVGSPEGDVVFLVEGSSTGALSRDVALVGEEGSLFGTALAAGATVADDAGPDAWAVGSPLATIDATTSGGAVQVWRKGTEAALWSFQGTMGDDLGRAVAFVPDADGDGLDDLLMGAPGWGDQGLAWLVDLEEMPTDSPISLTEGAEDQLLGATDALETGAAVACPGDLDWDGHPEVLVAAPGWYGGDGVVWVISVADWSGTESTDSTDAVVATLVGNDERLGESLSDGFLDVDMDTWPDIALGAPSAMGGQGAAYVVTGPVEGMWSVSGVALTLRADSSTTSLATALHVGDLDSDGVLDLILGIPGLVDATSTMVGGAWIYGVGGP